ncbi:MAG: hypothetical protein QNJ63_18140 [Calothrix sp. MO_192.B10]|nr:hypothetical protein [Calothrix sp. MO_192.B10]
MVNSRFPSSVGVYPRKSSQDRLNQQLVRAMGIVTTVRKNRNFGFPQQHYQFLSSKDL